MKLIIRLYSPHDVDLLILKKRMGKYFPKYVKGCIKCYIEGGTPQEFPVNETLTVDPIRLRKESVTLEFDPSLEKAEEDFICSIYKGIRNSCIKCIVRSYMPPIEMRDIVSSVGIYRERVKPVVIKKTTIQQEIVGDENKDSNESQCEEIAMCIEEKQVGVKGKRPLPKERLIENERKGKGEVKTKTVSWGKGTETVALAKADTSEQSSRDEDEMQYGNEMEDPMWMLQVLG